MKSKVEKLFFLLVSLLVISCATKKNDSKPEVTGNYVEMTKTIDMKSNNKGMLKYEGATPSQMLEKALTDKDVKTIASLLSHTFGLEHVTENGKTIRERLLESGDEGLIKLANNASDVNSRPEGIYY